VLKRRLDRRTSDLGISGLHVALAVRIIRKATARARRVHADSANVHASTGPRGALTPKLVLRRDTASPRHPRTWTAARGPQEEARDARRSQAIVTGHDAHHEASSIYQVVAGTRGSSEEADVCAGTAQRRSAPTDPASRGVLCLDDDDDMQTGEGREGKIVGLLTHEVVSALEGN
jgi:hypothetical protein